MIQVQLNDGFRRGKSKMYVKDADKIKQYKMLQQNQFYSKHKIKEK